MKKILVTLITFCLFTTCVNKSKEELTIKDINIFSGTPVWELAESLEKGNIERAKELVINDSSLVNYRDPYFGTTLLMRYVSLRNQQVVEFLINNGANADVISETGSTALFRAISFPWNDVKANKDSKFVELILKSGANPNIPYCAKEIKGQTSPIECGTSPLMYSISRGMEKTNLLLEAGADINYKTKTDKTAAIKALMNKSIDTAYELIVVRKADVYEPFFFYSIENPDSIETNKPHYPVDLLLSWVVPIDSPEYIKKMAIVDEFSNQGIDYQERKAKVDNLILRRIKKIYPNSWEEYLKKY